MTRVEWGGFREGALLAQRNACALCDCIVLGRFDVLRTPRGVRAYHPRCRLKVDGKARAAKAVATRRARRDQLRLQFRGAA